MIYNNEKILIIKRMQTIFIKLYQPTSNQFFSDSSLKKFHALSSFYTRIYTCIFA